MTTFFFVKVKKKNNDQFSEPFWNSYLPESAGKCVLRLFKFENFLGGHAPTPSRYSRLRRSQKFPVPLEVAQFKFNNP